MDTKSVVISQNAARLVGLHDPEQYPMLKRVWTFQLVEVIGPIEALRVLAREFQAIVAAPSQGYSRHIARLALRRMRGQGVVC